MSFVYDSFIYPIIYILPAYVANGAPVIFGRGKPLDAGKTFRGARIFGDHKTIRGLIFGIASGIIIGGIESVAYPYMLFVGIMLSIGAHVGDLLGSFIKRQAGIKEGGKLPIMDQYLFFLFAILFAAPLGYLPNYIGVLFLVALTGILHVATNVVAYKLKLKKVPW